MQSDDNRKIECFEEKGKKYQANNLHHLRLLCYRIDGQMIQGTIKSCDFGMGIPDKSMFYLIELKGTDIKHATEQIKSAFEELHKKLSGIIFHARIVLSKTPRPHLQPSNYRELKVKFAKYNGTVESRSIFFNEDITQ